ncbi:Pyrin [Liparis tanakae]|uniref:Pyrin n=1 Tax=Liparis tanakae TaxID=230148 RepID=A0A4Z2EUX4_9TELE|nr:Pyrin [Liparis tanakae]
MKRSTEVEKLSLSEDHLHLLQGVQSLNIHHPPPTKDWSQVSVPPASHEGTVSRAVSQLEETLSNMMKTLVEVEMKRVQKFAVDVTLNPETAHHDLILSDDGTQKFSSEKLYYEVQVKQKTDWSLGVVRESANRKGLITSGPQKVGVFVDYEEGLVSFYDVEAAALIYSFTGCSFKEKLLPYFSPGHYLDDGINSSPLIITPVGVN